MATTRIARDDRELFVYTMLPNFLFCSCRISARTQDCLHLPDTRKHNLPSNEPPNTLMAGWAGQTALIGPKLVKILDRLQSKRKVHIDGLLKLHLIKPDHWRELVEESAVEISRIQTER